MSVPNRFIYEEATRGTPWGSIMRAVKKHKEWEPIETENGIKDAANRYAERLGLEPPPTRQPGRQRNAK